MTHHSPKLRLAVLALLLAGAGAMGCSSPLASRRAQVMTPGELEVGIVPYIEGTTFVAGGTGVPIAYPWLEGTLRVGIFDRVDLQLKFDPTIIPEVMLAYQLVGDPTKNELAFTIAAGLKPTVFGVPGAAAGLLAAPIEAIVDIPVGDTMAAVVGMRTIPAMFFAGGAAGGATLFTLAPGGFAAFHIEAGPFFIRPELAINGVMPIAASGPSGAASLVGVGAGSVNIAASLGFGGSFDFSKKPDTAQAAPVAPAAPAAAAPAAPAAAPLAPAPVAPAPMEPLAPADPAAPNRV